MEKARTFEPKSINTASLDKGSKVAVLAEKEDGKMFGFALDLRRTRALVASLLQSLSDATRTAAGGIDAPLPKTLSAMPLEARDIQVAHGRTRDEVLIAVRLSGCDLTFAFGAAQADALLAEARQSIAAIRAAQSKPQ